jgi:predicted nucleotidyltransferase
MAQRILLKVKRIIDRYRHDLEKTIQVERIILYGSHAYGTPHDGSDIDIVVISKDFKRMHPLERLEFLSLARRESKAPIEALGYTPSEFKKAKDSIMLDEIVERGIVVYPS